MNVAPSPVLEYLEMQPPLEYSDDAWAILVDQATVRRDDTITVTFKDEVSDEANE